MPTKPKRTVTPIGSPAANEAVALLQNLGSHKVFLYPRGACAQFDWQPLYRLTHQCDVFVFTDCGNTQAGQFEEAVKNIARSTPVADCLRFERLVPLSSSLAQGWGMVVELTRTVGSLDRRVHLVALAGNWVSLYNTLFWERKPPRFLCVKNLSGFDRSNGILGETAQGPYDNAPMYLVDSLSSRPQHWRWTHPWQDYPGWGARAWSAYREHHLRLQASSFHTEARKVIVKKARLDVKAIGTVRAVLMPHRVMVDNNTVATPDWPQPMAAFLSELEVVCRQHHIDRVACVPFGFEDEGPVLDEWRRKSRLPLTLDIYCKRTGDVIAFNGCVDELPNL